MFEGKSSAAEAIRLAIAASHQYSASRRAERERLDAVLPSKDDFPQIRDEMAKEQRGRQWEEEKDGEFGREDGSISTKPIEKDPIASDSLQDPGGLNSLTSGFDLNWKEIDREETAIHPIYDTLGGARLGLREPNALRWSLQ